MIKVQVNGADFSLDESADVATIGDVVGGVARSLDEQLRIVKVRINGEDITGRPERHTDLLPVDPHLELETTNARDLALETLGSIEDFHGAVTRELARTSGEFRDGGFERGSELLSRCVDGLQVLLTTTHSVGTLLGLTPARITAGDRTLSGLTGRIGEVLHEMIGAQENRDGLLIADLIEYELQVLLEDWHSGLSFLRAHGEDR